MLIYLMLIPAYSYANIIDSYESLLSLVHGLLSSICLLSGLVMLVASLAQFKSHRNNPCEVKLKTPITLFLLGLILLAMSYFPSPLPGV